MNPSPLTPIKKIARAGVVALTLGGTTMAALPAQASNPGAQFSFSLNFGNGGSFSVTNRDHDHYRYRCWTDREIFRYFARQGYRDIRIGRPHGAWVIVTATQGWWKFTYRVNRCNHRTILVDRDPLRRPWPNHQWGGQWGGHGGGQWGGHGGGHWPQH